jgi:two-component system, chemotaxis family, protein-glutamate methylesterase/glutaminase
MAGKKNIRHPERIVVIGASAGGFSALMEMLAPFPKMNVAIFVVLHMSPRSGISFLLQQLQVNTFYECRIAANDEEIKSGTIFFATPDNHLIISDGKTKHGKGAFENGFRPSIDVLFRSAAVNYAERTIGIILSGMLDDGVTGMLMIRRCGGVCIIQDPSEAEYGDMPLNVMEKMEPDYTAPVATIGNLVMEELKKQPEPVQPPADLLIEASIAENVSTDIDTTSSIGEASNVTCPDCGGTVYDINDGGILRYRCFTGHSFTEKTLVRKQQKSLESTLWVALRIMEERKKMLEKISSRFSYKHLADMTTSHQTKVKDLEFHIQQLKTILFEMQGKDV